MMRSAQRHTSCVASDSFWNGRSGLEAHYDAPRQQSHQYVMVSENNCMMIKEHSQGPSR